MTPSEHPEGFVATLAAIGAVIGVGKLLASDDPLTLRRAAARAILNGGIGMAAGAVMLYAPSAPPIVLYGAAAGLASVGASVIEVVIKRWFGVKEGTNE